MPIGICGTKRFWMDIVGKYLLNKIVFELGPGEKISWQNCN